MQRLIHGLVGLLYLAVVTRFRLRGRYWTWRMETALGSDRSAWPSARERRRAILLYGGWSHRLRRAAR